MSSLLAADDDLKLHSVQDALRAGLAGDVFQNLVNYHFRVALIVPSPEEHGPRIVELALEHATHPFIRFYPTVEAAREWLAQ